MRRLRLAAVVSGVLACSGHAGSSWPASGAPRARCDSIRAIQLELKLPIRDEDRVISERFPGAELSSFHFRRESRYASPGPDGTVRSPMLRIRLTDAAARRIAEFEPHLWDTVRDVDGLGPMRVRAHYSLLLFADATPVLEGGALRLERGMATVDFVRPDLEFDHFRKKTWFALGCR
jgi:hypothetical protein